MPPPFPTGHGRLRGEATSEAMREVQFGELRLREWPATFCPPTPCEGCSSTECLPGIKLAVFKRLCYNAHKYTAGRALLALFHRCGKFREGEQRGCTDG